MQALLLAGGLGTRLRSVVNDRPKPMALINDKPFLEHLLMYLKKNNIDEIVFLVGYKGSMVEEYFGSGEKFGINIKYSYEEGQLGTAGAIKNAEKLITDEYFYVLNADTFFMVDYEKLRDLQIEKKLDMALVLRRVEDVSRYGKVELIDNLIVSFNEKEERSIPGTINGGIYYLNKKILEIIPNHKCSLENEIIPYLLNNNYRIGGQVCDNYFIDIGIPDDYYRFCKEIKDLEF